MAQRAKFREETPVTRQEEEISSSCREDCSMLRPRSTKIASTFGKKTRLRVVLCLQRRHFDAFGGIAAYSLGKAHHPLRKLIQPDVMTP